MASVQIPDLIDNDRYQLADVLKGVLNGTQPASLDIATAFFNLRALEVMEPEIERLSNLRLLLGRDQEQRFILGDRLLTELESATAHAETTANDIRRWQDFLGQDSVSIRQYKKNYLHGKAYIANGIAVLGAVGIVGSSNFTAAGLTTNRELNAVLKQETAVRELQEWFEGLWAESDDYKGELLELLGQFTRQYSPYEIYIKIIYEALRDKLEQGLGEEDQKPSPIALADFQHDGYLAAKEILDNYGGVLIADSVGLGKTYLTLRLLDDYSYRERQTALIICPAAIKETVWQPLLQQFAIPHELVSIEEVSRREFAADDYAKQFRIIVVDESHNFRNTATNRWPNLFRIITRGNGDKKVILLTATPVNNTVFDLYHQLQLITRDDPKFLLTAGIPDLREYFRRAEKNKDALYEVLEALAVRRSRPFLRQNYPQARIDGQQMRFPERRLHTVRYSLKQTYGSGLYQRIAETIENLLLAPYQVETFRQELIGARRVKSIEIFKGRNDNQRMSKHLQQATGWSTEQAHRFLMEVGRQTALAHIMRVLYLKRLESSIEALRISLRRLQSYLQHFLQALNAGRLLESAQYRRWLRLESSDDESLEEGDLQQLLDSLPELSPERYDIETLRKAVEHDLKSLEKVVRELEQDRTDGKLEALKQLLSAPELMGRKVVVFSYFKDTARYLWRHLSQDDAFSGRRIEIVDSGVRPQERTQRVRRFAPRANGQPHLSPKQQIDLLISTDVLSEGQNLQDANIAVHYDLHWNPVRMVQRVGRLDRLGSSHKFIEVYNFFPEDELEGILGLVERLHQKLDAINRTVGLDASILGETPNPMDFNILRRIEKEDPTALQELEEESELTIGEFIKQDLLSFLKATGEGRLRRIPLGVGTARQCQQGSRGFFVAFRNPQTNHHHWLFYDEEHGRILERRLEAIRHIRCKSSEPPAPLPVGFDPKPLIKKLRGHLWKKLQQARLGPRTLPAIQRQVVNWLRSLPPSADRNNLLAYFEERPLAGPDLQALQRLWRDRSQIPQDQWVPILLEFIAEHPHPSGLQPQAPAVQPLAEEDLECIAWVKVG